MSETNCNWQEILERPEFTGYVFKQAPAPRTKGEDVIRFRNLCRENTCGCYGTTWGCPPGSCSDKEAEELVNSRENAIIVSRKYDVPDINDRKLMEHISKEFQSICRNLSVIARNEGIDNLPVADGGCTYCGKCSYPEPCRYPDRRVMSISGMGIDIGEYLGQQGIKFSFEKGIVTLYGLILY